MSLRLSVVIFVSTLENLRLLNGVTQLSFKDKISAFSKRITIGSRTEPGRWLMHPCGFRNAAQRDMYVRQGQA